MEKFVLHEFQNPLRLLFEFDITNQNYPRLYLRYLLSNPGKIINPISRVVVIYNFSETHYFTDHEKNNWENPFCNMRNLF